MFDFAKRNRGRIRNLEDLARFAEQMSQRILAGTCDHAGMGVNLALSFCPCSQSQWLSLSSAEPGVVGWIRRDLVAIRR